jgi:hypothetical protein
MVDACVVGKKGELAEKREPLLSVTSRKQGFGPGANGALLPVYSEAGTNDCISPGSNG